MRKLVALSVLAIVAALCTMQPASARDHWRRHHDRTIIVEQPTIHPIVGLLLLSQMFQQQPTFQAEQRLEPLPREPKLRRESPIPLK